MYTSANNQSCNKENHNNLKNKSKEVKNIQIENNIDLMLIFGAWLIFGWGFNENCRFKDQFSIVQEMTLKNHHKPS